ncbi:MAG: hypothetical protein ACKO85_10470 [Isosphaeraceae bacterium]
MSKAANDLKTDPGHARPIVRPRPAMFRALGHTEPPAEVCVDGVSYRLLRVFKHDSWAATALYQAQGGQKTICKFNRVQSIGPIPMRWLGRFLAGNESAALLKLQDTGHVPILLKEVVAVGVKQPNAIARVFIEGHPLGHREAVPEAFFLTLKSLLNAMHQRKMAYVDLHKRENVLVGDDGQPYLIDFQISFIPSKLLRLLPTTWALLSILQKSDDYHLEKLRLKSSPAGSDEGIKRPWWIRMHRAVAMPFRQIRRRMLVKIKVRSGEGRVHTEHFTEEGLRESQPQT